MSIEAGMKEKQGAVSGALSRLEKMLNRVGEEYEKFHNRISPVLMPIPSGSGKPDDCPQNPVALAGRIDDSCRHAESILRKMVSDNEQLEL